MSRFATPAVKGTLWTRIGLGLKFDYLISALWTPMGIAQFPIKRTLLHSFPHTHASTPAWEHPVGVGSCGHTCLISSCTAPILVHNVLFSKRIMIYEF